MKKWIISLFVILLLCGLRFAGPWFLAMVRLKAMDQHQRNQESMSLSNLATVEINNQTIRKLGQWPWDRNKVANQIIKLYQAGAAMVVVPILFADPDRFGKDAALGDAADFTGSDNIIMGRKAGCSITSGVTNVIIGIGAGEKLTTGNENVLIGEGAGACLETAGHNNVFIGRVPGSKAVSACFSVAIGCGTLTNMVGTGCNIGFGRMAGQYLTTGTQNFFAGNYTAKWHRGSGNIAIGQQALYGNSTCADNTGGNNVALGEYAGMETCNGSNNVFIGKDTGKENRSGSGNVYIGSSAGPTSSSASGGCNIIMGWDAGEKLTSGGENIILGKDTARCITVAEGVIAIGENAGKCGDCGNHNIYIGQQAGYQITGENHTNVMLGRYAGCMMTAGNSNVILGQQAQAASSTGSCQLTISVDTNMANAWLTGDNSWDVDIPNTLSKGGGSFKIDHPHPTKTATHHLVHSFIEGPQMDLIYRGKVDLVAGSATVNIDTKAGMTEGTFVLLNRDVQSFTTNETGWGAVKSSVSGNILTITAQDNTSTDTISWMVIGERQDDKIKSLSMTDDDGNLIVEPPKHVHIDANSFDGTDTTTFTTKHPHGYVATNNFKALNPSGNFIGNYSVKEVIGIHTFTATTTVGISTVAEVRLI